MSDLDLSAAQQSGFLAVEDLLIEFRDSRISIFPYANGIVVNEKDGSPSPIVRMRTRHATDLAIETAAPLIEAAVRAQAAADIEANLAERPPRARDFDDGYQFASEVAASLARGECS